MTTETESIELRTMLQAALGRIEKLENQLGAKQEGKKQEGKKLYRYFIPEFGKDGKKIPEEKRQDYLRVLQDGACQDNGGYTLFYGEGGYYPDDLPKRPFDPDKIVKEKVIIFDTYGTNPMQPWRLKRCQKYLYQSSLGIMSSDSYEFIDSNKIGLYTLSKAS